MTRLTDQAWLTAPATRAVMAALEAVGGPGCARFVGGCVRNALLGQPVDDVDIATTLRPDETEKAIRAAGLKAVPTGIAHGTVTAVAERQPFEITTLRRDVTTDGRNATVAFTDDWSQDAARRDFRLNALYADIGGEVFDPTGAGIDDAAAGRIVFVGDPTTRIREDYLRILRFFRFFAWYGRDDMDVSGLHACEAEAPGLTRLSAERVSKELLKLLAAPDPRPAVRAMRDSGVLARILPEVTGLAVFEAMVELDADAVSRLAALLPVDVERLEMASSRLRLSNVTRNRLVDAAIASRVLDLGMSEAAVHAAIYRHGSAAVQAGLCRRQAEAPARRAAAEALQRVAQNWSPPILPVGGNDIARLGVQAGPETGRLLKAFEDAWIAEDFPVEGHAERLATLINPPRA